MDTFCVADGAHQSLDRYANLAWFLEKGWNKRTTRDLPLEL